MCGNFRSANEAALEWEGSDWSATDIRTSTVPVQRNSTASIGCNRGSFARMRILLVADWMATVRTRILRLVGCAEAYDMCGF